ncbi:hypothetical protein [Nocardia sp. CNY236]|uniref:hypothetical protein n=1 Tax=Nocardia sp. CNY236 TaxID=1169152 RepID=UPI0012DC6FD7|nr:hypothetical protein [Nocardia sp. CNY236]
MNPEPNSPSAEVSAPMPARVIRPSAAPATPNVESLAWLRPGTGFTVPPVLFAKITDDQVTSWREQLGANDEYMGSCARA